MGKSFSTLSLKKFQLLSRKHIFTLLETNTLDDLAKKYRTNKTEICSHLKTIFPKNIGEHLMPFSFDENIYFDGIEVSVTVGAWMDSKEKNYNDYILKNYGTRR